MATTNSNTLPRRVKDITGHVYGRLTVIEYAGVNNKGKAIWRCMCECGTETITPSHNMRTGGTKSCGCLQPEVIGSLRRSHGMCMSPEYKVWSAMVQRCTNPKAAEYKNYGSRGITVCESWKAFENFYADMGKRPSGDYTLERIRNNTGYSPNNCRWETKSAQARNRRTSRLVTFNGRTQCLADWADETGIKPASLYTRLYKLGWSIERALTEPIHLRHTPAGITESVQPSYAQSPAELNKIQHHIAVTLGRAVCDLPADHVPLAR